MLSRISLHDHTSAHKRTSFQVVTRIAQTEAAGTDNPTWRPLFCEHHIESAQKCRNKTRARKSYKMRRPVSLSNNPGAMLDVWPPDPLGSACPLPFRILQKNTRHTHVYPSIHAVMHIEPTRGGLASWRGTLTKTKLEASSSHMMKLE